MPSPPTSSSTSVVSVPCDPRIGSLLAQLELSGAAGSGAAVSLSFPWTSDSLARLAGNNGAYSTLDEDVGTYHYGLNAADAAGRSALQVWANVANIGLAAVTDTRTSVGDIRFRWTSATESPAPATSPRAGPAIPTRTGRVAATTGSARSSPAPASRRTWSARTTHDAYTRSI